MDDIKTQSENEFKNIYMEIIEIINPMLIINQQDRKIK